MAVRLLRLGPVDPVETQAVYHALAERMDESSEDAIVITSPTAPYLCLGYHQIADRVLDREAARALELPVIRRRVGGGLTYLDANQLFYQFVFHHSRVPAVTAKLYASLLHAPVMALRRLGLAAQLARENEIEVRGRRIAGVGAARIGAATVVVGNVLRDFSYTTMAKVWRAPSDAFRRLATEALDERVTTLRREGADVPLGEIERVLVDALGEAIDRPLVDSKLREEEQRTVRTVARSLMASPFIDLHAQDGRAESPPLKISARAFVHPIADGRIRGALLVDDGRIIRARLESHAPNDLTALEERLVGHPASGWRAVLEERSTLSEIPFEA